MRLRLATKILKAQQECRTKRTNVYWVKRWELYYYAVYPNCHLYGERRDHRIDKAITVWHKTPRNRKHRNEGKIKKEDSENRIRRGQTVLQEYVPLSWRGSGIAVAILHRSKTPQKTFNRKNRNDKEGRQ